jgi:hypothetical protein
LARFTVEFRTCRNLHIPNPKCTSARQAAGTKLLITVHDTS